MLTKTKHLPAQDELLFFAKCCDIPFYDRDDWTAHQKTAHKRIGLKVPTAKPVKLRDVTLSAVEKEWLGKHVMLKVSRWVQPDPDDYDSGYIDDAYVQGYVWSFGPSRTVSITVYDEDKGHNILESGFVSNLTLA